MSRDKMPQEATGLASDWIDVTVALPPENTRCVVMSKDGSITDAYKDKRWHGGWVTNASPSPRRRGGVCVPHVVFWTPYPSRVLSGGNNG